MSWSFSGKSLEPGCNCALLFDIPPASLLLQQLRNHAERKPFSPRSIFGIPSFVNMCRLFQRALLRWKPGQGPWTHRHCSLSKRYDLLFVILLMYIVVVLDRLAKKLKYRWVLQFLLEGVTKIRSDMRYFVFSNILAKQELRGKERRSIFVHLVQNKVTF